MRRDTAKRLLDVHHACLEIEQFSSGESATTIQSNRRLQLILHKLLEIVGEALDQLSKTDPETTSSIPNLHRFVDMRNQITHGYETVNYLIIWQVAEQHIPPLRGIVDDLLNDAPPVKQS